MRKLTFVSAVGVLFALTCLPALADGGPPTATTGVTGSTSSSTTAPSLRAGRLHWFAGSVTAVGDASLTVGVLWTGPNDGSLNGQTLTLAVPTGARISEGPRRHAIALAQIQAGDLVAVRALGDDTTALTAAKIHVNCDCHWIGGTISSVDTSTSTFQVDVKRTGPYDTVLDSTTVTLQTNADTVYLRGPHRGRIALSDLQVGEGVGVVFAASGFFKAPGFDPATAMFTAKRVHVWGQRQVPPPSSDASVSAGVSVS